MMWLTSGSAWTDAIISQKYKMMGRDDDEDRSDDAMDHRR